MFDIHKIHNHQRDKIIQKMTDDENLNIRIKFIKNSENNSDKSWDGNLADCSVRAVKNPE